ncbi:hypothetical protein CDD82_789 [Ophiocordyceps australis]|uniref:Uncharacterized protein n=1 Tax=Ophiocordyceps australis TaxID=1399860 RepID=A0A2C5ZNN9_9HYPO|nr:hypothetical protein CDD82_789 [Ophiocordyceps australis]
MHHQSFARLASRRVATRPLAPSPTCCSVSVFLHPSRSYETAARTKRALKVAPHASFLPDRRPPSPFPREEHIIYNPPASEASPVHTPFLFLPENDPRRVAMTRLRHEEELDTRSGQPPAADASNANAPSDLPPAMRYRRREQSYHLEEKEMKEMRRLRTEDPVKWSVGQLAKKFNCSPVFVSMVAPAPPGHLTWLREKLDRKMQRWGPMKTQAREDRRRRAELLYRGEL